MAGGGDEDEDEDEMHHLLTCVAAPQVKMITEYECVCVCLYLCWVSVAKEISFRNVPSSRYVLGKLVRLYCTELAKKVCPRLCDSACWRDHAT